MLPAGRLFNLGRYNDAGVFQPGALTPSQIESFDLRLVDLPDTRQFRHDVLVAAVCSEIETKGWGAVLNITVGPEPGRPLKIRRDGWRLVVWDREASPPPVDTLREPLPVADDGVVVSSDPAALQRELLERHYAPRRAAQRRTRRWQIAALVLVAIVLCNVALIVPPQLTIVAALLAVGAFGLAVWFSLRPLPVVGPDPLKPGDLPAGPWES